MKKILNIKIFYFILGVIVSCGITSALAYSFFADDVGYSSSDTTWSASTVQEAIDDLHDKLLINYSSFKMVSSNKVTVEVGKKYLISVAVMSGTDQRFAPSISGGANVLATTDQIISKSWSGMITYSRAFIVESTDTTITLSGHPDYLYQSVAIYEIGAF